tara:strand:+ start:2481 stop:3074 length:594 start_codon:yes stop_codon:yes gene_type:complete
VHKDYNKWPDDIQYHYNKTKEDIREHGHSIKGTIDGEGHLERPFAYSLGASFNTNYEFISFFPIKNKGLSIVAKVMNKIINLVQNENYELSSKIIDDSHIYYLPVVMYVLKDFEQEVIQSNWAKQLNKDSFLSEFCTKDHNLVLLIFTDKDGNLPWNPKCENFWPDICPLPFLAAAEYEITGEDNLLRKAEDDFNIK